MKLKELREHLNKNITDKYDDYEVIFRNIETMNDENKTWTGWHIQIADFIGIDPTRNEVFFVDPNSVIVKKNNK